MGYSGLEHPVDSDEAADYISDIVKYIIKMSKVELKNPGNEFNTGGVENVAMFIYHMICPNFDEWEPFLSCNNEFIKLIDLVIKKLEELIERSKSQYDIYFPELSEMDKNEIDDKKGYLYHLNMYKKWLNKIIKMRRKLND